MPVYTFTCTCGKSVDTYRTIAKRDEPEACECGGSMTREEIPAQGTVSPHLSVAYSGTLVGGAPWYVPRKFGRPTKG